MENIRMKYKKEYQQMHDRHLFRAWKGNYDDRVIGMVKKHVKINGSKTLLDFGSGSGDQYKIGKVNEQFGISADNVVCYDPGVKEFEVLPDQMFDCIISTDVMEHIPEEELPDVIKYITTHARHFAYIVVFCGLAVKKFPDGTNVHVTIKRPDWWKEQFSKYNESGIPVYLNFKWPVDPKMNILNL